MNRKLVLVLGLSLAVATTLTAETRSFTLLKYGSLQLEVPDGWETTINQAGSESGPAFQFEPPGEVPLILLFTPIPVPDGPERLAKAVPDTANHILRSMQEIAVEKDLSIKTLTGRHCRLFYVSATDRTVDTPSLEDFKYADQGVAEIGEIMATFTVLTNAKNAPERDAAIEIVRSAHHIPAVK